MIHQATPEHEAFYQDMVELLRKYDKLGAQAMLDIACNMVGKMIAMQDQRKHTPEQIMRMVSDNIEAGNRQMIDEMVGKAEGKPS